MNASLSIMRLSDDISAIVAERATQRYRQHIRSVRVRADRTFALLMIIQWLAEIAAALWITPLTWIGGTNALHIHVYGAIFVGGAISLPVVYLVWKQPGATINQYMIGFAQVLTSALLIHLMGGRVETHFHVFGSLAFIALYRDWRVLALPTVVVALDHMVRGIFWPESVFGMSIGSNWRWLEHTGWILFEDSVLFIACIQAQREMRELASQWAHLSVTKDVVDQEVRRQMSELAASERRLRVSELRIRKIIDTAYDAFVVVKTNGTILEWSERAEALFGWPAYKVIGKDIRSVLGVTELSSRLCDSVATAMINNQSGERMETTAVHRSGAPMSIEASISAMVFNHEITLNVFFHDISVRKAMQAHLLHAKKMQGIGQLAAGIAHEINTPTQYASDNMRFLLDSFRTINEILDFLDAHHHQLPVAFKRSLEELSKTAELPYLRTEIPVAIEQAMEGVRRIGEITHAMKEFSHPGTHRKEIIDPRHVIQNTITVCRNEWKYVAEVNTEFDPELTTLVCLPGELSQVLVIMIVNAAQAIAENKKAHLDRLGKILIQTKRLDEWVEICIRDNGAGIAQENLERIFEPFFTTKEVGQGTGQGLAIAHSVIVEKHGGSISVASRVGEGTSFTLRLPNNESSAGEPRSHERNLINS